MRFLQIGKDGRAVVMLRASQMRQCWKPRLPLFQAARSLDPFLERDAHVDSERLLSEVASDVEISQSCKLGYLLRK